MKPTDIVTGRKSLSANSSCKVTKKIGEIPRNHYMLHYYIGMCYQQD